MYASAELKNHEIIDVSGVKGHQNMDVSKHVRSECSGVLKCKKYMNCISIHTPMYNYIYMIRCLQSNNKMSDTATRKIS